MTIIEIVLQKLPFLQSPNDDALITLEVTQSYYALQKYLKKEDTEVTVEGSYTELEKMLVAYYTSYNLITSSALKNLAGSEGENATPNQLIKKVKADVVETEFQETSGKNTLLYSTNEIAMELKKLVCQTARTLGISLPMCSENKFVPIPFQVYH